MKKSVKYGKTTFYGLLFYDNKGKSRLIKPHPEVKEYLEKIIDKALKGEDEAV